MTKVMAVLPDESVAEIVTDQLSSFDRDKVDWRLIRPGDNDDRIIPAIGWPLGGGAGSSTATGGLVGMPIQTDYPDDEAMRDRGADGEDAEFYGRSVAHGGIAIVVETSDDYVGQVRRILDQAGAQQVTNQ